MLRHGWKHGSVPDRRRALTFGTGIVLGLAFVLAPLSRAEAQLSLKLVLAVDCSSSVGGEEFDLQMRGLATAFRDAEVIAAIEQAAVPGIAVALLQWSGESDQRRAVDWTVLRDGKDARAFAEKIDRTPRFVIGGATAIGSALEHATDWLDDFAPKAQRMVIDVSGDGRANQGIPPETSRDRALSRSITVNGLAILNEEPDLAKYYSAAVIGGSGSFLLTAANFQDFERAIRKKLVFEISGVPIVRRNEPDTSSPGPRAPG